MAEVKFNTRFQLKYDLYDNWKTNNPVLKKGEVAIVEVPAEAKEGENNVVPQQPVILFKVGDGTKSFMQLDWASSKAADVYSWAKEPTRPTYEAKDIVGIDAIDTDTQYIIEKVTGDDYKYQLKSKAKGATSFTTVVADIVIPKYDDTALAGRVSTLEGLVNGKSVASQISEAIEALKLSENYAAKKDFDELAEVVTHMNGGAEEEGSFAWHITTEFNAIKEITDDHEDRITEVEDNVGSLENLQTSDKDNLVEAINEVRNSVSAGGTAAAITITTNVTTEGALKSYTVKQGDNTVGVIDIPKDMVVESGEVVTDPAGQEAGTYIKLVLANVAEPLYINVGHLVDIYKAKANAAQVQIAIDSATREISATIVAGSVGTTELSDNAVTTAKIANGNVTKEKLSTAVQDSLGKADSAVQSVTEGSTNGTVKVDGTDVNVHGLGTAAYKAEDYFAKSADFNVVSGKAHEHENGTVLNGITQDKVDAWDTAEQNAKDHADQLVNGLANIAKTGNVKDLVQDTGDVIVFYAGTSSEVF